MGKEDDWNSNFLQFSMYMHTLLFWVSVCEYPINVKVGDPIGAIFCVGPHMTHGRVPECSKLQKLRKCEKISLIPRTCYFCYC